MFKRCSLILGMLLALSASIVGGATAQGVALGVAETPELGQFLVDANGMTLYVFTKDTPDTSNCYDKCAENWPPAYAEGATLPDGVSGELSTITRTDGTEQLAFNGWPLYTFAKDKAAGDVTGQGVGDVWYVAATSGEVPGASPVASPVASPAAADTVVAIAETPELGKFLTDSAGMTLYIFTKDEVGSGKSVCNGDCAANWPAFYAEDTSSLPDGFEGELTVITRDDGSEQLAYNGQPLYYFIGDKAAGDTTGQEVGDVWYVATVKAAP